MKIDPFRPGDPAEYWQVEDEEQGLAWTELVLGVVLGAALMVSALGWREWL